MITIGVQIIVHNEDDLVKAYGVVYEQLALLDHKVAEWESTDEWYDNNGEAIPEDEVSAARLAYLNALKEAE